MAVERLLKIDDDDGIVVIVSARRTSAGGRVIRKGPFKGKRVELASTTGIERLKTIADDFMLDIFGFETGEYLITDLSSLSSGICPGTTADSSQASRSASCSAGWPSASR
jgi:hypothetical protein